jgi:hypothetical protein
MFYFIIIIIIITYYLINNILKEIKKKFEYFDNNNYNYIHTKFLTKNELLTILLEDKDNYYNTFFQNDFYARNVKNIDEYKVSIHQSVSELNKKQKRKIKKCIQHANYFFLNIDLKWFSGKEMNKIPWNIGCIKGYLYENGLPHTRKNVIILSEETIDIYSITKLTKTLIHEKIHIYQKINTKMVKNYLEKNNFKIIKQRTFLDNIRANPDLDNTIYSDDKNNIYKALYNSNKPTSIEDITYYPLNNQLYEHPFEKMAIEIENKYS